MAHPGKIIYSPDFFCVECTISNPPAAPAPASARILLLVNSLLVIDLLFIIFSDERSDFLYGNP